MKTFEQSPKDPDFVQNPYPVYDQMRTAGDLIWWEEFGMVCATSHAAVNSLLRDRRFGREVPPELATQQPPHLDAFYKVDNNSMLELEPPRHTRLRGQVLRAFTSRRIATLEPQIAQLSHELLDKLPRTSPDLLPGFCEPLPVIIICRLLGVPETMAPQLLAWSHDMVAMYQAGRTRAIEETANAAAAAFADFMRGYVETRRTAPQDDLITQLIAAEEDGTRLTTDELIATCILLLNAGHEATVHTLGNGIKTLLEHGQTVDRDTVEQGAEEILRYDPPLHMFTRIAYEPVTLFGHSFKRGDHVGLLLACANRDPGVWPAPERFDPTRALTSSTSFGGGLHFCVGAPLARLEMRAALPILFERFPNMRLSNPPRYRDSYHFRGLETLYVET